LACTGAEWKVLINIYQVEQALCIHNVLFLFQSPAILEKQLELSFGKDKN